MGHVQLSDFPQKAVWKEVARLLGEGASVEGVVAASATAAEPDLLRAASDPVFVEAVRLLLLVPQAARQDDLGAGLQAIDLAVGDRPGLFDVLTALERRLSRVASHSSKRNDLGEFAGRALIAAMSAHMGSRLPGLFSSTPEDVAETARQLAGRRAYSDLVRSFFGRLVTDSLSSWLDRTLSLHVGPEQRFAEAKQRAAFDEALAVHVHDATRIVQEFASGWTGKRLLEAGTITTPAARDFGALALKKIVEELRTGYAQDG